MSSNPTTGNESQFNSSFNTTDNPGINPTLTHTTQFNDPFNILPDRNYRSPLKPGIKTGQFKTPYRTLFNLGADPLVNPTTILPILDTTMDGLANQSQYESSWYYTSDDNSRYRNWYPSSPQSTNISSGGVLALTANVAAAGFPYAGQIIQTVAGNAIGLSTPYSTLEKDQLTNQVLPGASVGDVPISSFIKYWDFRSRKGNLLKSATNATKLLNTRADGLSVALSPNRNTSKQGSNTRSFKALIYSAAAASPAGAYSVFNLNAPGKFGYGFGDHDNPFAIRNDFTLNTEVATKWRKSNDITKTKAGWVQSAPIGAPFRGDKVNVIDFGKRSLKEAYRWKLPLLDAGALGSIINVGNITQDFIKFIFTGPNIQNGLPDDPEDDIIVFRASITSLGDSFNANWNPVTLIGRADPNYHYTGWSRDLSLNFDVYATSRDEMKPIWRKLNALAGYTTPEYNLDDIALRAPWMRITIGDLFHQQPVVINSLGFDYSMDDPWEINIEDDQTMMQVPFKVSVTCQLNVIMDYLPQKGGRFFSLAKKYGPDATPAQGSNNWLSDMKDNVNLADWEEAIRTTAEGTITQAAEKQRTTAEGTITQSE
tara:strand:+ start:5764 stop:7554 length:1791 start_codon:yes stop_codon:yes gene_type:complete